MLLVKSDERCCNLGFLLLGRVFQLNKEVSIKIDSSPFLYSLSKEHVSVLLRLVF